MNTQVSILKKLARINTRIKFNQNISRCEVGHSRPCSGSKSPLSAELLPRTRKEKINPSLVELRAPPSCLKKQGDRA